MDYNESTGLLSIENTPFQILNTDDLVVTKTIIYNGVVLDPDLYIKVDDISGEVFLLDTGFSDLSGQFQDLSSSFIDLSAQFQDLSSSFIDLSGQFQDLSSSFIDLSGQFQDLSSSFIDLSSNVVRTDVSAEQTVLGNFNTSKLRINQGNQSTSDSNSAYITYDGTYAYMSVNNNNVISFTNNAINFIASAGAYFDSNLVLSGDNNDVVISKTGGDGKSLRLQAGDDGSTSTHYIELIARDGSRQLYTAMRVDGVNERIETNRDLYMNGAVGIDFANGSVPSVTTNKLYYDAGLGGGLKYGSLNLSLYDTRITANASDITTIKGAGWVSQTIKGNADDIITIKGSGWNNQTIKGNADNIFGNSVNIFINQSKIAVLDTSATLFETRITDNENNITALDLSSNYYNTSITALDLSSNDYNARITTNESDITTLQGDYVSKSTGTLQEITSDLKLNGDVGIGVTNGGVHKLDVFGTIDCSGIYVNGSSLDLSGNYLSLETTSSQTIQGQVIVDFNSTIVDYPMLYLREPLNASDTEFLRCENTFYDASLNLSYDSTESVFQFQSNKPVFFNQSLAYSDSQVSVYQPFRVEDGNNYMQIETSDFLNTSNIKYNNNGTVIDFIKFNADTTNNYIQLEQPLRFYTEFIDLTNSFTGTGLTIDASNGNASVFYKANSGVSSTIDSKHVFQVYDNTSFFYKDGLTIDGSNSLVTTPYDIVSNGLALSVIEASLNTIQTNYLDKTTSTTQTITPKVVFSDEIELATINQENTRNLQIYTDDAPETKIQLTTDANGGTTRHSYIQSVYSDNTLRFSHNSSSNNQLVLNNSNQLGVNKIPSLAELDLSGGIAFTGDITNPNAVNVELGGLFSLRQQGQTDSNLRIQSPDTSEYLQLGCYDSSNGLFGGVGYGYISTFSKPLRVEADTYFQDTLFFQGAQQQKMSLTVSGEWVSGKTAYITAVEDNDAKSMHFSYDDHTWIQDNSKFRVKIGTTPADKLTVENTKVTVATDLYIDDTLYGTGTSAYLQFGNQGSNSSLVYSGQHQLGVNWADISDSSLADRASVMFDFGGNVTSPSSQNFYQCWVHMRAENNDTVYPWANWIGLDESSPGVMNWGISTGNKSATRLMTLDNATGNMLITGSYYSSSDRRIKENIQEINDSQAYNIVKQLNVYTYYYKDKSRRDNSKQYGWMAQEVRKLLPQAVKIGSEEILNDDGQYIKITDFHHLAKEKLVPVLWSAVQEIQRRQEQSNDYSTTINRLKEENANLKLEVSSLQSKMKVITDVLIKANLL